jgi:hypothetical protein
MTLSNTDTKSANGTNGSTHGKSFPRGVHVPSLTWFRNTTSQDIDWEVQRKHLSFLIESGLQGSKYSALSHLSKSHKGS